MFERGQKYLNTFKKYWTRAKIFEHGQKIFELADGLGIKVSFIICTYKTFYWNPKVSRKKNIEVLIRFQIGLDPIMGAWNEPTISRLSNNL